jgi:hypothetical protein
MGLYDSSGAKLAQTWDGVSSAFFAPASGLNNVVVQTPFTVTYTGLHYVGMTVRSNATTFMSAESKLNTGTIFFGVEEDTGNAGSNMKATFNPNANGRTYRFWGGVLS